MHAVSRVLSAALDAPGPDGVRSALVREARTLCQVTGAGLLTLAPGGYARVVSSEPRAEQRATRLAVDASGSLRALIDGSDDHVCAGPADASVLARAFGWTAPASTALLVPLRSRETLDHVLVLVDGGERVFSREEVKITCAFAAAGSAALSQLRLAEEQAQRVAEQSALARAAKTLNESLDLPRTLEAICQEARAILDGDKAVVYRGDAEAGLVIEQALGIAPEFAGLTIAPGAGLSGRVVQSGRPMLTNDYQGLAAPQADGPFARIETCLAVPMRWDGKLQGVVSVGFARPRMVDERDLALLEAFAELGAVACRNATTATGLAMAACTDGLTGCLNHAAFQDGLRREVERAERTGGRVSVILVDLDDFKAVNESHGHPVGDEVLRRVGAVSWRGPARSSTRLS